MGGISFFITGCSFFSISDPIAEKTAALKIKLPHPKEPTLWHTENLFQEYKPPEGDLLQQCKNELQSVGETILTEEQLEKEIQTTLFMIKREDRFLVEYHWCFYDIMRNLDRTLENDLTSLDEKIKKFYAEMIKLWILAEALDFHLAKTGLYFDKEVYFSYLRSRYLQISKNVFGQDVTIVGQPFHGRKFLQHELPQAPVNSQ